MNRSATVFHRAEPAAAARRNRRMDEFDVAVLTAVPSSESACVLNGRITECSATGARLCTESPLACDRVWLVMGSKSGAVVEAEIIWSDYASAGPGEIRYGVNFLQVLDESELSGLIETMLDEEGLPDPLAPSAREREECLFALFRGHAPYGARSSSTV